MTYCWEVTVYTVISEEGHKVFITDECGFDEASHIEFLDSIRQRTNYLLVGSKDRLEVVSTHRVETSETFCF